MWKKGTIQKEADDRRSACIGEHSSVLSNGTRSVGP